MLLGACFIDEGVGSSVSASATSSSEPTVEMETSSTETSTAPLVCMPTTHQLAMTPECVEGSMIASAEWADMYCATAFGAGWRWLEHHIQGGWDAGGQWIDDVGAGERGWIHIENQDAECFSSAVVDVGNGETSAYGLTWLRPVNTCQAACRPADGLDPAVAHPHAGGCNPYEGDTPCSLCKRLICVMG